LAGFSCEKTKTVKSRDKTENAILIDWKYKRQK